MDSLRLSLLQWRQVWEDPAKTRQIVDTILIDLPPSDLVILPEMWTTGFSMNTKSLAETMSGPTVQWMKERAAIHQAVFTGSMMIFEEGNYYNRLIFARPDGQLDTYDKKHMFGLAGEDKYFLPGNEKKIINFKGWKICPMICYDLRFPVWSRNNEDYDLLLYVAQFPQKRSMAWNSLLRARAIENVAYAAGVNGLGTDGNGIIYQGDSAVFDFEGNVILHMEATNGIRTAEIKRAPLAIFRRAYPFLKDRDKFHIP